MRRTTVRNNRARHALGLLVCALTLSACGKPEHNQHDVHESNDVAASANASDAYANPNAAKDTALRPSSYRKQQELKDTFGLELTNPTVRVSLDRKTVRFQITRSESGRSEVIALSGAFDDPNQAWLVDEGAVGGRHRIKGLAYCLASTDEKIDCSDMFVTIYFKHKGELIESQFIPGPRYSVPAPAGPDSQASADDPCQDRDRGRDGRGGESSPDEGGTPACSADSEGTVGVPGEENAAEGMAGPGEETTEGEYVAPRPPDHFLDDLVAQSRRRIAALAFA